MLDPRTLIVITAIVLSITSIALILAWYINRRMDGTGKWTLGYLLIAFGSFMHSMQGELNPVASVALANHAILAGFYICWLGVRRLQGSDNIPLIYFLLSQILLLLLLAYVGLDESGLAARTVIISTLLATTSLLIAGDLLSEKGRKYSADKFTGILFTLLGITFFLRAVSLDLLPVSGNMLTAGIHTSITYLLAPVFAILVAFGYILMQSERLQSNLRRQADTDYLTGLYSRRCVIKLSDAIFKRAQFDNTPISVIVMDLDKFKSINDTYGHQVGDSCLKGFAESLRVCLRPGEIIGRMGGEEFVAVLQGATLNEAMSAAERIRSYFEKINTSHHEHRVSATVSIGVASNEQGEQDFESLFKMADAALYQAKRSGRNRVVQHPGNPELSAANAEA